MSQNNTDNFQALCSGSVLNETSQLRHVKRGGGKHTSRGTDLLDAYISHWLTSLLMRAFLQLINISTEFQEMDTHKIKVGLIQKHIYYTKQCFSSKVVSQFIFYLDIERKCLPILFIIDFFCNFCFIGRSSCWQFCKLDS